MDPINSPVDGDITSNHSKLKSLHSLAPSRSEKKKVIKCDTIPLRLEFIKELLGDNTVNPIADFNNTETENFLKPTGNIKDGNINDTRYVLGKQLLDFYTIINRIGGKLVYIKSGTTGHTFKGVINQKGGDEKIKYAVKVVGYPRKERYGSMHDIRRPENAELLMIRVLSYFVVNKETPHIVLPIGTFNTSIKPFVNLIEQNVVDKSNKKYRDFVKKYKKGEFNDEVSILVSEWANRGDFLDFIRKNYKRFRLIDWKVFFFQVLSTLAVIQKKYPAFRHNDLKANNILVHRIYNKMSRFRYVVNGSKYILPNIGYQLKIWDFDFACIPGIVDNAKVNANWTSDINVSPKQNRYYDMHYFLNTLIRKGFFQPFMSAPEIPQEAKDFINRIVPAKHPNYRNGKFVAERGRILINEEYLTPDKVLKTDHFFKEFRRESKSKSKQLHDKLNPKTKDIFKTARKIRNKRKTNGKIKKLQILSNSSMEDSSDNSY